MDDDRLIYLNFAVTSPGAKDDGGGMMVLLWVGQKKFT
jgi:hypothetical protein